MTKQARILFTLAGAAILGLAAYWYFSPYLAMHALRSAAQARDAERFNAHVDFPRLRANMKQQFAAKVDDKLDPSASGFGNMLGRLVIDKMVDAAVRPETTMRMVADAAPAPHSEEAGKPPSEWTSVRESLNRVVAFDAARPAGKRIGIVFERNGFADWKLTNIELEATP